MYLPLLGIFILMASPVFSKRETHHLVGVDNGNNLPQDIVYDTDENTVTITIGDVSDLKEYIPTVNYHDFDTGYVVFKDIRRKHCLLSHTPLKQQTPQSYRSGKLKISRYFDSKIDPKVLKTDIVAEIAGKRIAEFCSDYRTFWRDLYPIKEGDQKTETRSVHKDCHTCYQCKVLIDLNELPDEELEAIFG